MLVSSRFQVYFTLLCKTFKLSLTVLVRYRCVIVFSLAGRNPLSFLFKKDGNELILSILSFPSSNKLFLTRSTLYIILSYLTGLNPLWLTITYRPLWSPVLLHVLIYDKDKFMGYKHFRSPLLTLSLLIYFPPVTKMFQFTGYYFYLFWISPLGNLGFLISPPSFSFFLRPFLLHPSHPSVTSINFSHGPGL